MKTIYSILAIVCDEGSSLVSLFKQIMCDKTYNGEIDKRILSLYATNEEDNEERDENDDEEEQGFASAFRGEDRVSDHESEEEDEEQNLPRSDQIAK